MNAHAGVNIFFIFFSLRYQTSHERNLCVETRNKKGLNRKEYCWKTDDQEAIERALTARSHSDTVGILELGPLKDNPTNGISEAAQDTVLNKCMQFIKIS